MGRSCIIIIMAEMAVCSTAGHLTEETRRWPAITALPTRTTLQINSEFFKKGTFMVLTKLLVAAAQWSDAVRGGGVDTLDAHHRQVVTVDDDAGVTRRARPTVTVTDGVVATTRPGQSTAAVARLTGAARPVGHRTAVRTPGPRRDPGTLGAGETPSVEVVKKKNW